jgi:hypothetical protein
VTPLCDTSEIKLFSSAHERHKLSQAIKCAMKLGGVKPIGQRLFRTLATIRPSVPAADNSIQLFIIYVLSQQLRSQLQT